MKMKMKNRPHKYVINIPMSRHEYNIVNIRRFSV